MESRGPGLKYPMTGSAGGPSVRLYGSISEAPVLCRIIAAPTFWILWPIRHRAANELESNVCQAGVM